MSRQLKRRRSRARRGRRLSVFPFIVGGIVVAFALAMFLSRGGGDDETAPVTVSGESLPEFQGAQNDPAVGMPAPEVEGESFDGTPVEILPDGTPTAIVFLAHWCPHCQVEVPRVQAWIEEEGPPAGVELTSVSTSVDRSRPNYPPSEWLEREGWTVPVLVDDAGGTLAGAFGLTSFPFWVFVDGDGMVVGRHAGEMQIEALAAALASLQATAP